MGYFGMNPMKDMWNLQRQLQNRNYNSKYSASHKLKMAESDTYGMIQ